eukprot:6470119-Prymnesium_polylepis.1
MQSEWPASASAPAQSASHPRRHRPPVQSRHRPRLQPPQTPAALRVAAASASWKLCPEEHRTREPGRGDHEAAVG